MRCSLEYGGKRSATPLWIGCIESKVTGKRFSGYDKRVNFDYGVPDNPAANPHSRKAALLYGVAALFSLAGLADSIYLTVEHISGRSVKCTIVSGCSEVLSSPYATVRGIPLALIGAAAYFSAFSLATLAAFDYKLVGTLLTVLVGLMFLTTIWLLYLQAFVIGHFCQFCLLSALTTTILTVLVVLARKTEAAV